MHPYSELANWDGSLSGSQGNKQSHPSTAHDPASPSTIPESSADANRDRLLPATEQGAPEVVSQEDFVMFAAEVEEQYTTSITAAEASLPSSPAKSPSSAPHLVDAASSSAPSAASAHAAITHDTGPEISAQHDFAMFNAKEAQAGPSLPFSPTKSPIADRFISYSADELPRNSTMLEGSYQGGYDALQAPSHDTALSQQEHEIMAEITISFDESIDEASNMLPQSLPEPVPAAVPAPSTPQITTETTVLASTPHNKDSVLSPRSDQATGAATTDVQGSTATSAQRSTESVDPTPHPSFNGFRRLSSPPDESDSQVPASVPSRGPSSEGEIDGALEISDPVSDTSDIPELPVLSPIASPIGTGRAKTPLFLPSPSPLTDEPPSPLAELQRRAPTSPPRRCRQILDYVAVPPFPRGFMKSDYRPVPRRFKLEPKPASGSLAAALSRAFANNYQDHNGRAGPSRAHMQPKRKRLMRTRPRVSDDDDDPDIEILSAPPKKRRLAPAPVAGPSHLFTSEARPKRTQDAEMDTPLAISLAHADLPHVGYASFLAATRHLRAALPPLPAPPPAVRARVEAYVRPADADVEKREGEGEALSLSLGPSASSAHFFDFAEAAVGDVERERAESARVYAARASWRGMVGAGVVESAERARAREERVEGSVEGERALLGGEADAEGEEMPMLGGDEDAEGEVDPEVGRDVCVEDESLSPAREGEGDKALESHPSSARREEQKEVQSYSPSQTGRGKQDSVLSGLASGSSQPSNVVSQPPPLPPSPSLSQPPLPPPPPNHQIQFTASMQFTPPPSAAAVGFAAFNAVGLSDTSLSLHIGGPDTSSDDSVPMDIDINFQNGLSDYYMPQPADAENEYDGNGTIDPSLLGGIFGGQPDISEPSPPRTDWPSSPDLPLLDLMRTSPSAQKIAGPSKRAIMRLHSRHSSFDFDVYDDDDDDFVPGQTNYSKGKGKGKGKAKAASRPRFYTPSTTATDEDVPEFKKTQRRRRAYTGALLATVSFCHHCRRSTQLPKMLCSALNSHGAPCQKLYCVSCITKRYPHIEFDVDAADFECPYCAGICNCTVCARKRGEEYVPERGGGWRGYTELGVLPPVGPRGKPNVVPRPPPVVHRPEQTAPLAAAPGARWGALFSLHGERVGEAYVTADRRHIKLKARRGRPKKVETEAAQVAAATDPPVSVQQANPLPLKRTFIGKPRKWWGRLAIKTHAVPKGRLYIGSIEPLLDIAKWKAELVRLARGESPMSEEHEEGDPGVWPGEYTLEQVGGDESASFAMDGDPSGVGAKAQEAGLPESMIIAALERLRQAGDGQVA